MQAMVEMGYSNDLTDKEWEIIEPLLLSQKKKTRPLAWTKRQILNGDLPTDYDEDSI